MNISVDCKIPCIDIFVGDFIYVMGGYSTFRLNSVERLNTITSQWEAVTSMLRYHSNACAVVLSSKIYILGGKDPFLRLKLVSCK